MPQTYSPPATGVDSASETRARPGKSSAVVTSSSQNSPTPASSTRRPISIACSGRQRWLMSHINLMSGPIASRILTMRSTSMAGVVSPGSASCVFISRQPFSFSVAAALTTRSSDRPRISAPEA